MKQRVAKIYPVKRMPRTFGMFDYDIPEEMEIMPGQLVKIPFRNKEIMGVVKSTTTAHSESYKRKPISAIIEDVSLSQSEIAFFEAVASDLLQSVPSLLYAALPTPPKRPRKKEPTESSGALTIPSSEAKQIVETVESIKRQPLTFVMAPDLKRMSAIIAAYVQTEPERAISVITPTVADAKQMADKLAYLNPFVITGEESNNVRFDTWKAWRSNASGLLIGTRVASLLPHQDLSAVFLVRSGHPNHKQADQNPRYDTRRLFHIAASQSPLTMVYLDVLPRVDDLAFFDRSVILDPFSKPDTTIVSLTQERPTAPHPFVGFTTFKKMSEVLDDNKRVVCVYNKKGKSRKLLCLECDHAFACPACENHLVIYDQYIACHRCGHKQAIPMNCPSCKSDQIVQKGYGNQKMKNDLQKLFPNSTASRIDKETEGDPTANILLVTNAYLENNFSSFNPPVVGLVVLIDADMPLYHPTFRSTEDAMLFLEEWRGTARACHAPIIIQTQEPELFKNFIETPYQVHYTEWHERQKYGHPPFRRFMKINFRGDKETTLTEISGLASKLRQYGPEISVFLKKGYKPHLEISLKKGGFEKILPILRTLPDQYTIDTNQLI